jgi:sugar diacid utilization regulator
MAAAPRRREDGAGLGPLEAITEAVESGAGLPEVVRAAARALGSTLALIDAGGAVLAVAARSPSEERALLRAADGVSSLELRVADAVVGELRLRPRDGEPDTALLRIVMALVASEVERVRAPERASEQALADFLQALLGGERLDGADLMARGSELGVDLSDGGAVAVVRAHPLAPAEDGWRSRVHAMAERGARAVVPGAIAAPSGRPNVQGAEVLILVPQGEEALVRRLAASVLRELESGLHGFSFAIGLSRTAAGPHDLRRAGSEALLAANVADAGREAPVLAFAETGAYRLLLPAMSEDPGELQRFYEDTVAPLAAYDEQYETELVETLGTFLECDGNVAGTAQRLYTHRHTVRYRLERVRDLSGLDVGSSDGREKLGLGLKAMRVLGIAAPGGPARERGAEGGRVPRERKDR